jgi:hypothetical protein
LFGVCGTIFERRNNMKTFDQVLSLRDAEMMARNQDKVLSVEAVKRILQLASARVSAATGIPVLLTLKNDFSIETNPLKEIVELIVEVDK